VLAQATAADPRNPQVGGVTKSRLALVWRLKRIKL
jgi:hypothetical protein